MIMQSVILVLLIYSDFFNWQDLDSKYSIFEIRIEFFEQEIRLMNLIITDDNFSITLCALRTIRVLLLG